MEMLDNDGVGFITSHVLAYLWGSIGWCTTSGMVRFMYSVHVT